MTIKNLILELLEYPMNAEILVSTQEEDGNYRFQTDPFIADYGDGTIGLVGSIRNDVTGKLLKTSSPSTTYNVYAHPYCNISGTIDVPEGTTDPETYIDEHFNDISFGKPDLDFCGTDYEIEEEEE